MSSDLLRRAAAKLREHASGTTPASWTVERYSHGYDDGHTWRINGPTDDRMVTPCALETRTEDASQFRQADADAAFATLMHPPVALALAEFLDFAAIAEDAARAAEGFVGIEAETLTTPRDRALRALARAVLREPEVTP